MVSIVCYCTLASQNISSLSLYIYLCIYLTLHNLLLFALRIYLKYIWCGRIRTARITCVPHDDFHSMHSPKPNFATLNTNAMRYALVNSRTKRERPQYAILYALLDTCSHSHFKFRFKILFQIIYMYNLYYIISISFIIVRILTEWIYNKSKKKIND